MKARIDRVTDVIRGQGFYGNYGVAMNRRAFPETIRQSGTIGQLRLL